MSTRDKNFEKTERELRIALQNLRNGQPTNPKLIERLRAGKTVKVNNQNVEIEARKANGLIGKYHEIIDKEINAPDPETLENWGNIEDHPDYERLNKKLKSLRQEKVKFEKQNKSISEEITIKSATIEEHLTTMNNMLAAMWEAIPTHEIEARMRTAHQLADVVHISKNKNTE